MTFQELRYLAIILSVAAGPLHAAGQPLGSAGGANLIEVESEYTDFTCLRLDARQGDRLAYVSLLIDLPGRENVRVELPWRQVASAPERNGNTRLQRYTFMSTSEPAGKFSACLDIGSRGKVSMKAVFAHVSTPYLSLEIDAGSLPRNRQERPVPVSPENRMQADVVHTYTPDVDVMESGFGQFLTPTGPHLVQARIPGDREWDRTSPCFLVTSRQRPDEITVQLKLPLVGDQIIQDANSFWRVTDYSRTPITDDAGVYRWTVGPTSLLSRDRYSSTWTAFLCMQNIHGSEKHIRNYLETVEVLVKENGKTILYRPGEGKPRYNTPSREAEIKVKQAFTPDSLTRIHGREHYIPAAGLTYRIEPAPTSPDNYSSARLRPVRGTAQLDIRYKREINNGRTEHCYAIFNPQRLPLQTLALGYGDQPIPYRYENDLMRFSAERMNAWKVHIAQRNVGVSEQLAVLSNMDQGGRRHEYFGKLCLAEPPSLRGQMPDMSRIQYNPGFSKG